MLKLILLMILVMISVLSVSLLKDGGYGFVIGAMIAISYFIGKGSEKLDKIF